MAKSKTPPNAIYPATFAEMVRKNMEPKDESVRTTFSIPESVLAHLDSLTEYFGSIKETFSIITYEIIINSALDMREVIDDLYDSGEVDALEKTKRRTFVVRQSTLRAINDTVKTHGIKRDRLATALILVTKKAMDDQSQKILEGQKKARDLLDKLMPKINKFESQVRDILDFEDPFYQAIQSAVTEFEILEEKSGVLEKGVPILTSNFGD